MMLAPRGVQWNAELSTDRRRRIAIQSSVEIARHAMAAVRGEQYGIGASIRPSPRIEVTLEPRYERSRLGAQFVGRTTALTYAPTFGTRYLFGELDRRELALETRLNVTFSPRMTLQLFAQPLLSSGDYVTYKQLTRPRTFNFDEFEEGAYLAGAVPAGCSGGRTCRSPNGTRYIDFDGDGTADHSFADRDFNVRSLIGNAIFRWEYRPGSALFLVWQRQQEDEANVGNFDFSRDAKALFRAAPRSVFLIKASYWLGF